MSRLGGAFIQENDTRRINQRIEKQIGKAQKYALSRKVQIIGCTILRALLKS